MKLFAVPKVPMFLDTITHGSEKRDEDDVKIVTLTLRVADLSAKLATTLPDGVRSTLFKASGNASPRMYLGRVEFRLYAPRQLLHVFAAPDHPAEAIAIDQVRIAATYSRVDKDSTTVQFVCKVSFGPLSKTELEYVEAWRLNQRWVTFEEAEPGLFDDEAITASSGADGGDEDVPLDLGEVH